MVNTKHSNPAAASSPPPSQPAAYHIPVLLQAAVDGLQVRQQGCYVDCTLGGGGHAREILRRLGKGGRLVVFDQDPDARSQAPQDPRVLFVAQNFRHLKRFLRLHEILEVDGILADLGVSSHQLDDASRGFSTRQDADLDMRMDPRQTKTAYEVVQHFSESQLQEVFERYGELTNARTLARTLVEARTTRSLKTIAGFKQAIARVTRGNPHRYLAQVFQALRIEVNDELGALADMLQDAAALLRPGGRIAIITFHSLEDRMVKHFFKNGSLPRRPEDTRLEGSATQTWILNAVTKKPITPTPQEIRDNPRARSAMLRIAERKE